MSEFNEISMVITKAVLDKKSGKMRWSMSASDTGVDSYGDRTTVELFENFVSRIESGQEVPVEFKDAICEEDWCGGLPYVSISHLKSAAGANVPGDVEKVYVDGNVLKAKGVLHNDSLGFAVFQSLLSDLYGESEYDDKIRVSIGFLDLKHSHGDFIFERKSVDDVCEKCLAGEGDKVFLDGQLVHLALTRKPANPRTDMEVEKMADVKTREEDAESIVGKAQAAMLVKKSDDGLLVEKDEDVVVEEPTGEVVGDVIDEPIATVDDVIEEVVPDADVPAPVIGGLEKSALGLVAKAKELKDAGIVGDEAVRQLSEFGRAVSEAIEAEFTSPEQQMMLAMKSTVQDEVRAIVPEIVAELSKLFAGKSVAPVISETIPVPRSFQAKSEVPVPSQVSNKKLTQIEKMAIGSV